MTVQEIKTTAQEITGEIINKVKETEDDFIFTTVVRFMGKDVERSKIVMSKQLLCRALICFKEEHTEEYYRLSDESNARARMMEGTE